MSFSPFTGLGWLPGAASQSGTAAHAMSVAAPATPSVLVELFTSAARQHALRLSPPRAAQANAHTTRARHAFD